MWPSFAAPNVLRRADDLGQRYGCRPSVLLDIGENPLLCYWVDEAAAVVGSTITQQEYEDREAPDGSGSIRAIPIPDDFVPW